MKAKVFLIIIYIVVSSSLTAQEIQNFIGYYMIQEVCTSGTIPNYSDTIDYEIEIKSSSVDTFDIQFYLEAHYSDTIWAKTISDSTFEITLQTFQNFDNLLLSISGEGYVIQDSIKINYSSGGSGGEFECTCKGIKKKETGLNRNIEDNLRFQVFPNPFNESTLIRYIVPVIQNKAMISIYDLQGKQIESFSISQTGTGEITISASSLIPGIYIYNLIVDGNEVDSKRMILTE